MQTKGVSTRAITASLRPETPQDIFKFGSGCANKQIRYFRLLSSFRLGTGASTLEIGVKSFLPCCGWKCFFIQMVIGVFHDLEITFRTD